MLPSFGTGEVSQILPYIQSKTKELANDILAGTCLEQTNTFRCLNALRQGCFGDMDQCKDLINETFRAQL